MKMNNKTFTDKAYDLVDIADRQKRRLPAIIILGIGFAAIGLFINVLGFSEIMHRKGGVFDLNTLIIYTNLIVCSLFILIGTGQYLFLRNCSNHLKEIELLEEKIHQEVFKTK